MPKVYLTDEERTRSRLAKWVYGEMRARRMSQSLLARKMNISRQSLSKKLLNQKFDFTDFVFFVHEFQPSDKELREIIGE